MNIYLWMFVAVIILSPILAGTYKGNKRYIYVVAFMLFTVCALRGVRVGADLGRYETHYRICSQLNITGLFAVYQWENIGFYLLMRIHSKVCGYNYHSFLFLLAVFEGIVFTRTIYKHSVNPYMSFLMYMALGYYTFIFSGLKQALAMAFVFLAFDAIIEKKKVRFAWFTILAFFVHLPSIIILPAYFIAYRKLDGKMIVLYIAAAMTVYFLSDQLASRMAEAYDTVVSMEQLGGVGGKVLMMVAFIVLGYILRVPNGENESYAATFNFMIIAAILQIFAIYGNVFERLADYYFIFAIIYLPFVFEKSNRRDGSEYGMVRYSNQLYTIANVGVLVFSFVYFYITITATYGILPYRIN